MDAQRWDRIEELFHQAADLPRNDQQAFLRAACGDESIRAEVAAMLEEDSQGASLLDSDLCQVAHALLGAGPGSPLGQFGKYRILRQLGEGGMGIVYLAEREDLGNHVAIKILRDSWSSMARRERFAREQKTLAALNHPSIARLYDADTSADGTPWFVMEYVDGLPLAEYCEQNRCSLQTRLKLFRDVSEAVEYAHRNGIIHRDLKPSNILVKNDGSVRLLDFGIAKQLDLEAPVDQTRTGVHLLTPAYASPEQIRGLPVTIQSDVYSLGVILYELLTGRLPFDAAGLTPVDAAQRLLTHEPEKPSTIAPQTPADLDVLCLTAAHRDPQRRYRTVGALLRDVDHYMNREPLEARPDSLSYVLAKFAERNRLALTALAAVIVLLAGAAVAAVKFSNRTAPPAARPRSVAVLPFRNASGDSSLDYLGLALANQTSGTLEYVRDLSVRPFEMTRKYGGTDTDVRQAGRELHVFDVISGHFLKSGGELQLTMEMIEVDSNRMVWRQTVKVPAGSMLAMQAQVAARTLRGLVSLLGGLEDLAGYAQQITDSATQPKNEEAYTLFLHAVALPSDLLPGKKARAMLEKSVALDPGYAPAWAALSARCAALSWYGDGGTEALRCAEAAMDRATALDPYNVGIIAGRTMAFTGWRGLRRSYQNLKELLRRRPDSGRLHFAMGYVLRYAGMLEQSESECDAALLVDAQDAGVRSCAVAFMLHGDYERARDYLRLDLGSEWQKAITVDLLLREGKEKEAWEARPATVPQWGGYAVLLAALEHRSPNEIAALARAVVPNEDGEVNYFSAAHLAYAGQADAALTMLRTAIEDGYCSYPAIDTDPLFASVRGTRGFAPVRSAGIACNKELLADPGR
jgi:serine/threonine protein kinase